jgi:hypothetical protein
MNLPYELRELREYCDGLTETLVRMRRDRFKTEDECHKAAEQFQHSVFVKEMEIYGVTEES